jgi:Fur family ferric uptake transcriptional regulator
MDTRESRVDEILSSVRGAAKRVTAAKRTVAEVLVAARGHLTVDEVTIAVQNRRPDVSPSTVYRILEEFEDLNVVVHTHLGQSAAVYHLSGAVHGHLTCERCHKTVEISATHFDALSKDLLKSFGFSLNRHHVAISGTCAHCLSAHSQANL